MSLHARSCACARRARGEEGFTLVELLTTMVVALIMLAAILGLWVQAAGHERANASRHDSLDRAATALERMTREVRESVSLALSGDDVVELRSWTSPVSGTPSALHDIRYDCGAAGEQPGTYACTREDATAGAAPVTVLDGLTAPGVFALGAGDAVRIQLAVAVTDARNPIVLRGGAAPRNP